MKKIEISAAAKALGSGDLVAMPTETVYGLAGDAANEDAVRQIFQVKGRPYGHPLIVHIAGLRELSAWAREIPSYAWALAEQYWPGPLTLVFKKQLDVSDWVTGGQDTIGLRVPNHPVALALLQAFGRGVAAPSANRFTHVSPTTLDAVAEELGDKIKWGLEGGACTVGLESAILDVTTDPPALLRPGMVSAQAIANSLDRKALAQQAVLPHATRAPGMHPLHYAPRTKMQLLAAHHLEGFLRTLSADALPVAVMARSTVPRNQGPAVYSVRMPQDARAYAQELYRTLRRLDQMHFQSILVEIVPDLPEWDAIQDRLLKASSR
jgi:L-threonylcarbamoyladenylate synthase